MRNSKPKFYTSDTNLRTQVPTLPQMPVTDSNPNADARTTTTSGSNTAFQRIRSYDVTVNKIDLNVVGAAPILGRYNKKALFTNPIGTNNLGLYTGALNNIYFNDDIRLLSTIRRTGIIKYAGIDFNTIKTGDAETVKNYPAIATWIENMNTVVAQLEAAMYTDLKILDYNFQAEPLTNVAKVLTPLQYIALSYQIDVLVAMIVVLQFDYLVAQLPKLQELYRSKSDFFVAIQDQLKRSQFTATIKQIKTWLLKRWIDKKFVNEFVLPIMVSSKKTDGLNSPIEYLLSQLQIILEPIQRGTDPKTAHIITHMFTQNLVYTRDEDGSINKIEEKTTDGNINITQGIFNRVLNAFTVDTILDLVLSADTLDTFKTTVQQWINTALSVVNTLRGQTINFAGDETIIQFESALSKLSTAPGTKAMNWQQNTEFNVLLPITEYTHFELVSELVTFSATVPKQNSNGYIMNIPMYKATGIPKQIQLEDFQVFYLNDDSKYVSFYKLDNTIEFRTRANKKIQFEIVSTEDEVVMQTESSDLDLVSLSFQDAFPAVKFKNGAAYLKWVNPDLMTWLPISYQNRWAEYVVKLAQMFIVPTA